MRYTFTYHNCQLDARTFEITEMLFSKFHLSICYLLLRSILHTLHSEVITKVLVFFLFVRWQIAPQGQTFSFSLSNSYNNLEKILEIIFANSNNGCIFDPSNTMKCLCKNKKR